MAKKRLTEDEYAAATGLTGSGAEELYRKMREWRRAKTQADLKRGLYLTQSAFAAMGGRPIQAYKRDYMTPEQVQAMQASLLKEINNITEGRRKSAEDYRRSLLSAATTVYAQKSGASREAAQRAGRLLEIRYKALFPQTFNVGGGSGSGQGGKGDPKYKALTETQSKKMQKAGKQISNMWVREDDGTIRLNDTVVGAPDELAETMREWEAAQRPEAAKEYGRDVDQFRKWAQHAFPGDEDQGLAAGLTAPLTELTGLSMTEMREKGILSEEVGGEGLNREAFLAAVRDRNEGNVPRAESFVSIWDQIVREENASASGVGGGGGGLTTVEGITAEQYKAFEDAAQDSLGKIGVGGGGDFSALLQKIVTAAPGELPGLEAQIKESIALPVSQGEAEPGRTPAGEGTLPPGASGETPDGTPASGTNPGDSITQKIQNVRDPDAGLDQLWDMYERLDNAQTTERDLHLMGQIQASPQFKTMQQKLGISDPKAAIKAAKMLMRQRRRDERFRDAKNLSRIRRDTNRSALMGGLANRRREAMPPTVDKGSSGAAVMGGAGGFDTPDKKEREV